MKQVRHIHTGVVLSVLSEFKHAGEDFLVLTTGDAEDFPDVFRARFWVEHKDPRVKAKAAEEVAQAVSDYIKGVGSGDAQDRWDFAKAKIVAWEAA
jgi:hypothetical protein